MSVHLSEIIKDCKPSCVPNPCQNKATCKELWSSYECICKNPWAHLGTHCEESKKSLYIMQVNLPRFRTLFSHNTKILALEEKFAFLYDPTGSNRIERKILCD